MSPSNLWEGFIEKCGKRLSQDVGGNFLTVYFEPFPNLCEIFQRTRRGCLLSVQVVHVLGWGCRRARWRPTTAPPPRARASSSSQVETEHVRAADSMNCVIRGAADAQQLQNCYQDTLDRELPLLCCVIDDTRVHLELDSTFCWQKCHKYFEYGSLAFLFIGCF